MTERRRGRPKGAKTKNRRATDPIDNLQFHAAPHVSAKTLAEYWGFHYCTVAGWCRTGYLPAMRVGRQYRIATKDARQLEAIVFRPEKRAS